MTTQQAQHQLTVKEVYAMYHAHELAYDKSYMLNTALAQFIPMNPNEKRALIAQTKRSMKAIADDLNLLSAIVWAHREYKNHPNGISKNALIERLDIWERVHPNQPIRRYK